MVFSRDIGGGSSSEMAIPARQGVSRGSNCTSAHQWFTRDTPEKSVELERHQNEVEGLRGSPTSSGRGQEPEACPARLRLCYGVVEVGWWVWSARSGGRSSLL